MNTTAYITFSAIDFTGNNSLSSYSLSATPLTFIPNLANAITNNMVWDFGDGTVVNSFSATKHYDFPGDYTVTLVQYDCNTNAMVSTETKTIRIVDWLPLTFSISDPGVALKCGRIRGPYSMTFQVPWYQPRIPVFYDVLNSDSMNYWDIQDNKFCHLDNSNCLFESIFNYSLSSPQYQEMDKVFPDSWSPIYVRVVGGSLVRCSGQDSGSCFAGLTATKDFYMKDDCVKESINTDFRYDKTQYTPPYAKGVEKLNNFGITLSAKIDDNVPVRLSITSNGLDGEGYPITSFDISPVKFHKTKIPFVVKMKDSENFTVKNFPPVELSALNMTVYCSSSVLSPGGTYTIRSLNDTLSAQNHGGSFRGYIWFDELQHPITNVRISVSGTFTSNLLSSYSLSGESSLFNVFPKDYYDLYKKNENFDATQTLKDLRFQEILLDKDVLFDSFFGDMLGYQDLYHDDIGVKTYEKITNFVQNTQDLDTCGIEYLDSMGQFAGYNDLFEEKFVYPEKIKRLVDLFSIDKNRLLGYKNQYSQNFDSRGHLMKDVYGINTGNQIDVRTYSVSSGVPIVALEKFSNGYVLLNTWQPVSATGSHTYPLSSYSGEWGWPLVLPDTYDFIDDIGKYYMFFEYVDVADNTVMGGVIDFENSKTTIPFDVTVDQLNIENGIKEHMFMDILYQSLSLLN